VARLAFLLALALALTGAPRLVRADAGAAGDAAQAEDAYLLIGADPVRAPRLAARARAWAAGRGHRALDLAEEPGAPSAELPLAQLELLAETERALLEARELGASLREAAALRVLEAAETKLLGALELPGVHAYLAEVNVQLGLCAAQLGAEGLAETALARAFSLDRTRRVEAAETPPATLALAQRIARSQAAQPVGEQPLGVTPASAHIWLDGAPLGAGATMLRAPPGVHLLVARAAAHAPYAALLRLEPGRRPGQTLVLSPLPEEEARRALFAARQGIAQARAAASLLARTRGTDVYLFEAAHGPLPRALVHRCSPAGCAVIEGVEAGSAAQPRFASAGRARAWLEPESGTRGQQDTVPVWRRWPLWTGAAAIVVAGVATALLVTRERPIERQRQLEIDPGSPPP
jgi:hypothetical protein